jgi:hypothetical protein
MAKWQLINLIFDFINQNRIYLVPILKHEFYKTYTGCIMKNLWCYNFLIFYPILINDMSNKIVLNGLQFELIQYLFLSSVFDK